MVRTACRRFLMLWAMSPSRSYPADAGEKLNFDNPEALLKSALNPREYDLSFLYRGSNLDD